MGGNLGGPLRADFGASQRGVFDPLCEASVILVFRHQWARPQRHKALSNGPGCGLRAIAGTIVFDERGQISQALRSNY